MTSTIKDILREIDEKTQDGYYIYRGEPEHYDQVSSKLYRNLVKQNDGLLELQEEIRENQAKNPENIQSNEDQNFLSFEPIPLNEETLTRFQQKELRIAREHTKQVIHVPYSVVVSPTPDPILEKYSQADLDLLAEIQHMGGSTRLIDFTSNPDVALYFASSSDVEHGWESTDEDGRIIIVSRYTPIASFEPNLPQNRIISQQSVFVMPQNGYIDDEDLFITVTIPKEVKQELAKYLAANKGITDTYIYNDIMGYIQHQKDRFWESHIPNPYL